MGLRANLDRWLDELPEKQCEVLSRRFGLRGYEVTTLENVGKEIGLTRERVRQIQVDGLKRLRLVMESQGLDAESLFAESHYGWVPGWAPEDNGAMPTSYWCRHPIQRRCLTFQQFNLVRLSIPFFCVSRRFFHFGNVWPHFGQFGVQLDKLLLIRRNFIFRIDRFYRTFWLTQSTVNTFIWMNDQKIRPFVKTVNGADLNTICVFAFNAVFSNNKSHCFSPLKSECAKCITH